MKKIILGCILLSNIFISCSKNKDIEDVFVTIPVYAPPVLKTRNWTIDSVVFLDQKGKDSLYFTTSNVSGLQSSVLDFSGVVAGVTSFNFHDKNNAALVGPVSSNISTGDTTIFRYQNGIWGMDDIYNPTTITGYNYTKTKKLFQWGGATGSSIDRYDSTGIKAHYIDSSLVKLQTADTTIYYHINKRISLVPIK